LRYYYLTKEYEEAKSYLYKCQVFSSTKQRKPTNLKVSKLITKKVYTKFTEILDACKANDPTSLTSIGQEVTSGKPRNNTN